MKLSKIVIDYRSRMQISQREFSRRCGLSNSYISFIENEYNPRTGKPIVPTLEQYQKLAGGMGMSVHQLFEQLDEDSPVDLHVSVPHDPVEPMNDDVRIIVQDLNKLTPEQLVQAKNLFRAYFQITNNKGDDDQ